MGTADAKDAGRALVTDVADSLIDLSHRIHAHPELCFEEEQAASWCAEALTDAGLTVEMGVADLPTAFVATAGSGGLTIGICAEYDALPAIGHACGHNVIAAAAVGAGAALARLADDLGITVKVLGTPAEEGGGGKVYMLERGAFDGLHAAMMVHPAPTELDVMPCLAVAHVDVAYTGKEAHASAAPFLGRNAADALTIAQTAIGLLRQHMESSGRVHGIVTHGGDAPNIIPAHTRGKWYIRESTMERLAELQPRVEACFEAGALATGCDVAVELQSPIYSEMRDDVELRALWRHNAEALGRKVHRRSSDGAKNAFAGSTDMANVSLALPAIHPMLGLGCDPVSNHQPEFAAFCVTEPADKAILDGAIGMVWTAIDAATDAELRARLLRRERKPEEEAKDKRDANGAATTTGGASRS